MGEFADDALDREINESLTELDEDSDEHPYYVKVPEPKIGDKCDQSGCNGIMVERTNSKTKTKFLGCSEFPKCKKSYSINFFGSLGKR